MTEITLYSDEETGLLEPVAVVQVVDTRGIGLTPQVIVWESRAFALAADGRYCEVPVFFVGPTLKHVS